MNAATAWRSSSTSSQSRLPHRHCSFRVRMKRSATPLPWGSPADPGVVFDAEPPERTLEVMRSVLAAPVVTELDAPGHVGTEKPRNDRSPRHRPARGPRSGCPPWPRAPRPRRCSGRRARRPTPSRRSWSRPWWHRCPNAHWERWWM